MFSKRNLDNFYRRGQGEHSRKCVYLVAVLAILLACFDKATNLASLQDELGVCLAVLSPAFGTWVVCVYRLEAVESPTLIDATTCAFFAFSQNLARFFARQGLTLDVKLAKDFAYAKHTVLKPARHSVQQPAGIK